MGPQSAPSCRHGLCARLVALIPFLCLCILFSAPGLIAQSGDFDDDYFRQARPLSSGMWWGEYVWRDGAGLSDCLHGYDTVDIYRIINEADGEGTLRLEGGAGNGRVGFRFTTKVDTFAGSDNVIWVEGDTTITVDGLMADTIYLLVTADPREGRCREYTLIWEFEGHAPSAVTDPPATPSLIRIDGRTLRIEPAHGPYRLTLFDMTGGEVMRMEGEGESRMRLNDLPAGHYIYRITAGDRIEEGRIVLP